MKTTQTDTKPMMSAAQPPKVAGHLFEVRSPKKSLVETPAGSLDLQIASSDNLTQLEINDDYETPRVKKQYAGLW